MKTPDGQIRKASVKATDAANDMALVQVIGADGTNSLPCGSARSLGEGIATFGYPHLDMLANTGNFTLGNVTALAGVTTTRAFTRSPRPFSPATPVALCSTTSATSQASFSRS